MKTDCKYAQFIILQFIILCKNGSYIFCPNGDKYYYFYYTCVAGAARGHWLITFVFD